MLSESFDGKEIYFKNKEFGYIYMHSFDKKPDNSSFKLHNHNNVHEILIFIKGNSKFNVEGTTYYMTPFDIVVARSSEMHRMCHLEPLCEYDRIIFNIDDSFFVKMGCPELKKVFTDRPLGINNLISAKQAEKHNISDIIKRLEEYIKDDDVSREIVIRSTIIELLYKLNKISVKSDKKSFSEEKVKDILMYINDNLTSSIGLCEIADRFFLSKYYLCHMFKEQTGLTINQYISYKRIMLVRELCAKGSNITDASIEAGFGDYSNFYKIYKKETGHSPKKDLIKNNWPYGYMML